MSGRKRKGPSEGPGITKYFCVASSSSESGPQSSVAYSITDEARSGTQSPASSAESSVVRTPNPDTVHATPEQPQPQPHQVRTQSLNNNDIGSIVHSSMTSDEGSHAVGALTPGEKYTLLTEHYKSSHMFKFPKVFHSGCNRSFPKVFHSGCNRSFQYKGLDKYPWLIYSKILDGGFCKYCVLFAQNRKSLGFLVNKPFTTWVKVNKVVDGHAANRYHIDAVEAGLTFKRSVEHPEENIDVRFNTDMLHLISENRQIVKCCAEAVLYCGRQCIALRGDNEKLDQPGNPGNFLALLKVMSTHDHILKCHLEKPRLRNATYISPHTQNEIIDIIGFQIIQKKILGEVRQARFFAIMVDEVTSHNKELMPLCIRFVDEQKDIREEFIQFSTLVRVTGEAIAAQICNDLAGLDLDVKNIRGQGYDGASNMSSERIGVQALIKQQSPLATYTHCSGHCLNLVISHSCSLPVVRNVLDQMKQICLYFLKSPKRNELLSEIVKK